MAGEAETRRFRAEARQAGYLKAAGTVRPQSSIFVT
jgi:hypothetical protein